jgi:hypothetical protein
MELYFTVKFETVSTCNFSNILPFIKEVNSTRVSLSNLLYPHFFDDYYTLLQIT